MTLNPGYLNLRNGCLAQNCSNASESIRREEEAKKKWRRQTGRKNDCVARDRGRRGRRERDKRDADIKLETRQIKTQGIELEQRRAKRKKKNIGSWRRGWHSNNGNQGFGDAIYYKQNIYRGRLFTDKYAFRNMLTNHSTLIAPCPETHIPTVVYRATLNLPQTLHWLLFCLGSIISGNKYTTTQTSRPVRSLSDRAEETGRRARSQSHHTSEKGEWVRGAPVQSQNRTKGGSGGGQSPIMGEAGQSDREINLGVKGKLQQKERPDTQESIDVNPNSVRKWLQPLQRCPWPRHWSPGWPLLLITKDKSVS